MPKGTYCLIFTLKSKLSIQTKSGKKFKLNRGTYLYVGSAYGSGGIEGRVKRHLKKEKKKHWHLDFITTSEKFKPQKIITIPEKNVECQIASQLQKNYKSIERFGCSDCNCFSHLFKVSKEEIKPVIELLKSLYNIQVYSPKTFQEEEIDNKRNPE